MKKILFIIAIMLASIYGFGQATPANHVRVATATTDFGVTIPIGTSVYDIGANKYYICIAAALTTDDLTSASAKFSEVGMGASHAALTLGTANGLSLAAGQVLSLGLASAGVTGALSGTDWSTFNSKLSSEVDGSITNEGSLTVVDGSGTAAIHSNTSASTDVTIAVSGALTVNGSGSTLTIANTSKIAIVEDFDQTVDSIANNRCYFQLSQTPAAGTISVQLNGVNLKPTTQYLIITNKLRIGCAVYSADKVSISYSY